MFVMGVTNVLHVAARMCARPIAYPLVSRARSAEMEIKQLKALIAIVETGSFGEAASRLSLTQSAISHQIRHLEDELGETLLIRGKPHVVASASGRAVLASAYVVLAEV